MVGGIWSGDCLELGDVGDNKFNDGGDVVDDSKFDSYKDRLGVCENRFENHARRGSRDE